MKKLAILLFLMLFLSGCSDNWGWYVVSPYSNSGWINLKFLMSGYYFTLLLSFTSILISIAVGLLIALPGLSEVAARVAEGPGIYSLTEPIKRLSGMDVPIPYAPLLEKSVVPQLDDIVQGAKALMRGV